MKRRRLLLAIVLLLTSPALVFGAYKGYWRMKGFPPDVNRFSLAEGANPEDFPEHPGKVEFYEGNTLVSVSDAKDLPDDMRFDYKSDMKGRLYSRVPIVKYVKYGNEINGLDAKGNSLHRTYLQGWP